MSNTINTTDNVIIPQSEIDDCPVCLEPLTNNIKTLSCNHKLCNICYDKICKSRNCKCPLCRKDIIFNQNNEQNITHPIIRNMFIGVSDQPINIQRNIPQNITHLSFGNSFNQPINIPRNIPLNITHLSFGDSFN